MSVLYVLHGTTIRETGSDLFMCSVLQHSYCAPGAAQIPTFISANLQSNTRLLLLLLLLLTSTVLHSSTTPHAKSGPPSSSNCCALPPAANTNIFAVCTHVPFCCCFCCGCRCCCLLPQRTDIYRHTLRGCNRDTLRIIPVQYPEAGRHTAYPSGCCAVRYMETPRTDSSRFVCRNIVGAAERGGRCVEKLPVR